MFGFLKKYYFEKFDIYFQKYCLKACLQKHIIETCKCFDAQFPINGTEFKGCYEVNEISCTSNATSIFYSSTQASDCYAKCPVSL